MIKVLLLDTLSQKALELLGEIPEFEVEVKTGLGAEEIKNEIKEYEAVVIRGTTLGKEILKEAGNLKIIVKAGTDLDNIDIEFARARNIEIRNTPFAAAITAAEYTLAQMLGICRFIGPAYQSMKNHCWERNLFINGIELYGKTAGIIGFGRIGKELARREIALGMNVLFYDAIEIKTSIEARQVSLRELLKEADFISIHVPLTNSSRHLISFTEFEHMKKNAVLINVSRSGVVDEEALLDALKKNKIRAAAMDVHENEFREKLGFINNEKIFPTPYLGAATIEGEERACVAVFAVLKEFFNV